MSAPHRPAPNREEKSFRSLETLRFLASVLIVLYHYSHYLTHRYLFKGTFAVDLFFVLSGFVITYAYAGRMRSRADYLLFINKRLARLYPLHAATLLFYLLLAFAAGLKLVRLLDPEKYQLAALLPNATLTHAWGFTSGDSFNAVSWSISAEFGAYLLFPLLLVTMRRGLRSGTLALAAIYACAVLLATRGLHATLPQLGWHYGVLRAIPGFAAGVWLYANLDRLAAVVSRRTAVAGFYLASLALVLSVFLSWNDYVGLASAALVVGFATIADHLGQGHAISRPWLSDRGELTYSIYMLHPVVATLVISGLGPRLFGSSRPAVLLSIALAMAVTYGLSRLSYERFEEPARRWWLRMRAPALPQTALPVEGLVRESVAGPVQVQPQATPPLAPTLQGQLP